MRQLVDTFKALSDETRLRILNLLLERECCVCEVMQALDISQTRASRNLGILNRAGLTKMRKNGLWSFYAITDGTAESSTAALLDYVREALAENRQTALDLARLKSAQAIGQGCASKASAVNSISTELTKAPSRARQAVKTVLFVCVHNSGRSQMAEAFFNRLARGKARAISAGTDPANSVDAAVAKVMREVGIDIAGNRPKALTAEMTAQADKVITMGCGVEGVCPAAFVETEDWGLEDPKGKPLDKIREIRDEIRARVLRLLGEINKN